MIRFISAIETFPKCIDARYLFMRAEFFALSKNQADDFVCSFLDFIKEIMGDQCILSWSCDPFRASKIESISKKLRDCDWYLFAADGVIKCETIPNKTAYRIWDRETTYPRIPIKTKTVPDDYTEFLQKQLSLLKAGEISWHNLIVNLFSVSDRIAKLPMNQTEIGVFVTCDYENEDKSTYCGSMSFTIPVYCCGSECQTVAEKMIAFLSSSAETYTNINARVSTSSNSYGNGESPYMRYFAHLPNKCTDWKQYPFHFICGAEWFNIISPRVQKRIPELHTAALAYPELEVHSLSSGAVIVKCPTEVTRCSVADLIPVKKLLYEGLLPGSFNISKEHMLLAKLDVTWAQPRLYWENIPVFDDEILETETQIILRHKNYGIRSISAE